MSKKCIYIVLLVAITANAIAQRGQGVEQPGSEEESNTAQVDPKDRLRSWQLLDDFTLVDSLAIDTITSGFQQYNPIYKYSFSNIHLGNSGSAYHSNLLSYKEGFNEFIFLNSLQTYFVQPEDIIFFNSKVPYTNLTYINASPKRRSEENVTAFFTQNINKRWNLGMKYHLLSSVGLYSGQQTDNRNFNFFMSYNGDKYSIHGALIYNKAVHYLNGGIKDNNKDLILKPEEDQQRAEDILVDYTDAINSIENYQFFITQSLGIGKINLNKRNEIQVNSMKTMDSTMIAPSNEFAEEEVQLPVSTVYHTMHFSSYKRTFNINDLSKYMVSDSLPIYEDSYKIKDVTADTTRYSNFKNTIQIKFNEEANSILKFGVRAYVTNEIKNYKYLTDTITKKYENEDNLLYFQNGQRTFISTHIGGQVFKNIGENFWWNIGGKLYVQGYKAGDIQVEGNLRSLYRVFKDTAGLYARAKIDLKTPEFLQEYYYSNHLDWDQDLKQEKIIDIEAGLNIPTRNMKLAFESKSFTDYIYWNNKALPEQTSELINAFQVTLNKNFKFGPFHSNNRLAYQFTSNKDIYPLPDFAGFSSNYFNFYLAQRVLNVQIGMDVKYHTEYYAPAFMPATGQFYVQKEQKVGNYPFLDAFMNLQLKRARIFLKFDHINQSFMDKNYFLTLGYPHAPMRFKWGLSWNFFD